MLPGVGTGMKKERDDCILRITARVDLTDPKEVHFWQAMLRNFDIQHARTRPGYMLKKIMGEHELADGLADRLAKRAVRSGKPILTPATVDSKHVVKALPAPVASERSAIVPPAAKPEKVDERAMPISFEFQALGLG